MKILVADDHELFLKGLELILRDFNPQLELVFAKNYTEIFRILEEQQDFGLVLTDLAMPGANGLEAVSRIHTSLPETPIIILSAVFDREIVHKTLENGAAGYIPKTSSNAVIISAVNLVLSGGVYIPPELLREEEKGNPELDMLRQLETLPGTQKVEEKVKILSPRQLDVLRLVSLGRSNKQIAYELGLTEGTVKLHVTAILKLLNVYNRTGAVMEAGRLGLLGTEKKDG